MAQRVRKSAAPKPKARYRVMNWRDYNRALVARGAITLWIDAAVVAGWGAVGGKGWRYSDMAILCALGLRAVFGLTLRQTQGLLEDLTRLLGLEITVPHYSIFSRRAATLAVPVLARPSGGPLHLAVDATGLKVYGEGEWKVRVHGPDKRVIRKSIKTRGSFPSEDAAEKLIYLAIRGHEKTSRTVRGWLTAVNQFAITFEDRFSPLGG